MCIAALPLLGAVLSIAQAGAGFAAASQQADAQNAAYESNRQASIVAMTDRYAAINNDTLAQREAASQDLQQKRTEGLVARSKAATSSGEAGVTGLSVDALLNDFQAQQNRKEASILTNYDIKRQHNADELISTRNQAIQRIQSVRQAASPSAAGFVLQGLGGALGAFSKTGAA